MASAKQHELFNKRFDKMMQNFGATSPGKWQYKYQLNTKAGLLYLTVHEPHKSEIFSVFCMFEQPQKAKAVLSKWEQDRLNDYSGKWNYHQRDASYLLGGLEMNLSDLVINNH